MRLALLPGLRAVAATTVVFTFYGALAGGLYGMIAGPFGILFGALWGGIGGYVSGALGGALGPRGFWVAGEVSGLLLTVYLTPVLGPFALPPLFVGPIMGAWFSHEYRRAAAGDKVLTGIAWLRRQFLGHRESAPAAWTRWIAAANILGFAVLIEYLRVSLNVILW